MEEDGGEKMWSALLDCRRVNGWRESTQVLPTASEDDEMGVN